ncbi:MAG: ferritin-like domain-containing protein [Actinomycetota bacterium]|nr:ferritin-like domain-containing protein [Actinomycetota bacterium]MDQ3720506.1 ferritin-like domain-containing protein [Actinomycetota bacterium]
MSNDKLAAPELGVIEVQGMTRQSFMIKGALAAGTVYGVATVAPFVSEAIAQEGGGDVDILNFALTLEYLETAFYEQGLKNVSGLGGDVKELATTLKENEAEHVDALTEAIKGLGGTPTKAPGVDFGKAFSSQKAFLKTAQTFEDLGVSAYNGAAPQIKSKEVLGSAGAIVQIEARHAAAIRQLNKQPITESAFDKALEMQEVLAAAKPFIKG